MNHKGYHIYALFGCLLWMSSLSAQINIKIGYGMGLPDLEVSNMILSEYMPTNREVQKPFGKVGFVHGIQLGARYKSGSFAVELGWESMTTEKNALSYRASDETFDDRVYDFALKGFSVGLDQYLNTLGFGTSLHLYRYSIDRIIGNNQLEISNSTQPHINIHLNWQIQESSRVSLIIRPYYRFALSGYDVSALRNDIGASIDNLSLERPQMFGLSVVFYNGRQ